MSRAATGLHQDLYRGLRFVYQNEYRNNKNVHIYPSESER
jgi:hypothetical protein